MMGGMEEHIRQFNNYNTIFGSFWFNILCVCCNLLEIVTSVVLLGYYHSLITIDYIWWPLIEMTRLFILTILRFDVMLKGVENYNENRNGFKYTKRLIVICNLIGFFIILIGAPIYLSLLSTPTNSLYEKSTIYAIFMSIYPVFILIRILLSLPMYCTLIIGTNPIYEINQGYQRIDDAVATRQRRRNRRRSQRDGYDELYDERETHEERVQRQIRRQWRLMELERRQMELALEQSRRDAYRNTRKQQDNEYERALREHAENERNSQELESIDIEENNDNNNNNALIEEENTNNNINNGQIISSGQDDDIGIGIDIGNDDDNDIYNCFDTNNNNDNIPNITLDPLPSLPDDNNECVYIRIRLPNGIRSERRFHFTSTIDDILLWTNHECLKHKQIHLINHSQLISTMPHTVYNDKTKNMKMLNFWRPNAKRKLVSPLLYVEEL